MKNQRGLTLVELLAVLALTGILVVLLGGVLLNGMKASTRNTVNQQLQQETNYLTEVVKNEYMKKYKAGMNEMIKFEISEGRLTMDGKIISEGYNYNVADISRKQNPVFFYLTVKKDGLSYRVETSFSKLE